MAYSLLLVLQDLYHEPYVCKTHFGLRACRLKDMCHISTSKKELSTSSVQGTLHS